MKTTEQKALLFIISLQSIVESLDYLIDNKMFTLGMKNQAKDFLNRTLIWLNNFYKKDTGVDISELSDQVTDFIIVYENAISIAQQMSEKEQFIQDMYKSDVEALMKKYSLKIN